MEEIVLYFNKAGAKTVEFHPVFKCLNGADNTNLTPGPEKFVYNFLKARSLGHSLGMRILYSGSRINDFHNRYCMLLQDNLTLTPDGFLTNCFYRTWNFDNRLNHFFYGKYETGSDRWEHDDLLLSKIMNICNTETEGCINCFNQFHCTRQCPDYCPFDTSHGTNGNTGCLREKWLGLAFILGIAGYFKNFRSETESSDFFQRISYLRIR